MKSIKSKNLLSKKTALISSLVAVFLLTGVASAWYLSRDTSPDEPIQSRSDTEPTNTVPAENNSDGPTPPENKLPIQNETTEEPDNSSTLAAHITSVHKFDSTLQVRTMIDSITNTATCKLTLSKDGQEYTVSAESQALAKSSTCKGFDVPVSELSPGAWNLVIEIEDQGAKVHLSQNVTI